MRFARLPLLVLLALAPAAAPARAWKGVDPGATSQDAVVARFGEPTTRTRRGERTILAYYADRAPEGTRQAQFHVDAGGVVREITVFLAVPLDADSIEGTYGKPPHKTFVEDTFRKVWLYPAQGVTVYFDKDGNAEAVSFTQGKGRPSPEKQESAAPAQAGAGR